MNIKQVLTERWGEGTDLNDCWTQKELKFISEYAKLNILFNPISDKKEYIKYFESTNYEKLLNFYDFYNGCKLFSNSLCIYGIQKPTDDIYETYDLGWENRRLSNMLNKSEFVYFGSLGGQIVFALKKNSADEKTYCINTLDGDVVKIFENFDLLFSTAFENLYLEYDEQGEKIHKSEKFKSIRALYNKTSAKEFLEVNKK